MMQAFTFHELWEEPLSTGADRSIWTAFRGGVALDCRGGTKPWKLVHVHYTLCVLHRGRADWKYRQRTFSVVPGAMYICEPGEAHETARIYCPGDFTVLFLDPGPIQDLAQELGIQGEPHFPSQGIVGQELLAQFARVRVGLSSREPAPFEQELTSLTSQLLLKANANARPHRTSKLGVAKARRSLEDQFLADPTRVPCVRTLAQELGVPYHSLVRGFSQYCDIAPYELVTEMRPQCALLELRRGTSGECETFADVAFKWGYADGAHLTRAIRQHFGATPGALARQLNPNWKHLHRSGLALRPGRTSNYQPMTE